ncbi:MAG: peptidase [Proteobacteria bacterium]|nr:peptidase [Pseudomonadota bacterium]
MHALAASLLRGLRQNVLSGMRLALFLRVRPLDFRVSAEDYVVLFVFNLLVWLGAGMLRVGFPGVFNLSALTIPLLQVPLTLLVCLVIARLYGRRELLLAFALLLIAPDALFEIAGTALQIVLGAQILPPAWAMLFYYAYLAWSLAVILRVVALLAWWNWPRALAASGLLTALLAVFLFALPRAELWQAAPQQDDEDGGTASITQEQLFHAQTPLLIAQLDALEPERPGVTDFYFLGMAPFATQDVFGRELAMVDELLGERFDAAGRNILLSNNPGTLGELPIATVTHLRLALARIATVMNPDEDVLFLNITTHGSEGGELAFELPPLQLAQLTPAALSRILAESGIKWKALVISACYSGGFVEPLKDDNTLIITAAAADRQSFGCSNDEEFTYFGRAYFNEALRRSLSFIDAFDIAKAGIAARERAEKLEPSNPQIFVGAAMREKLGELEIRLKGRANIKQVNLRLEPVRTAR